MHVSTLGRTGIKVFSVGIGCATLGITRMVDIARVYEEKAFDLMDKNEGVAALVKAITALIHVAEENGYTQGSARILVDTAALYEMRLSEEMIGEVLRVHPVWRRIARISEDLLMMLRRYEDF